MDSNTTAEDQLWFNEPVTVQVEQDNRSWLDTMLEMKQEELISYGTHQYAIPEKAAQAVGRNDLITMIVMANKAGGGQSVSNQQYIYIRELKGELEPAVSLFHADDDPLYLVRGEGLAQQVYDKPSDKWLNLDELKRTHAKKVAQTRDVASAAADSVANHRSFQEAPAPVPREPLAPTFTDATVELITSQTPKREFLVKFAIELDIDNPGSTELFPQNQDLIDKIVEVNDANKKANEEK